ncbi:unnamed protein product [Porites lobata]|uniref:Uncharacterized protein n=1 Tax=Porites lobata TaxID=104759 RepID=A0ABN8RN85_9CNID|nr:unnamed protein product [Porites lobata]
MNCSIRLFVIVVLLVHLTWLSQVETKPCRPGLMMCNRRKNGKRLFVPGQIENQPVPKRRLTADDNVHLTNLIDEEKKKILGR